jgi:replicative DNA helicase
MNAPATIDLATLHSIELEQEILGAVLVNNNVFDVIEDKLTAADFFEPLHSEIFDAIAKIRTSHGVVTPALIIASIGGDASQIIVEGVTRGQYIARLAARASIPRNAPAYAKQIREFADRRKCWRWLKRYLPAFNPTNRRQISQASQSKRWTKSLWQRPPDQPRRYHWARPPTSRLSGCNGECRTPAS